MNDIIDVDTENMYEFCRALSGFEESLDEFSKGVNDLTKSLKTAMSGCSRYDRVVGEVKKSTDKINGKLQQIHSTVSDLHSRADFLEDFERGVDTSGGRRGDSI